MKSLIISCFIFFSSLGFAGSLEEAVTCSDPSESHQIQLLINFDEAEFDSWCMTGKATILYNNKVFDEVVFGNCSMAGFSTADGVKDSGDIKTTISIYSPAYKDISNEESQIVWESMSITSKVKLNCSFEKFDSVLAKKIRENFL